MAFRANALLHETCSLMIKITDRLIIRVDH